jgi:hypothetical protein
VCEFSEKLFSTHAPVEEYFQEDNEEKDIETSDEDMEQRTAIPKASKPTARP